MPYYSFKLYVPAPPRTALDRFSKMLRSPRGWNDVFRVPLRAQLNPEPFIGKIRGDTFTGRRAIAYRNSFLPMLWARVEPQGVGSKVLVRMYLHPFAVVFMLLWLGATGNDVVQALKGHGSIGSALGFFGFGLSLMLAGFIPEAIKAKRLITTGVTAGSA